MELVDLVAACVEPQNGASIVDVGCGNGEFLRELAARLRPGVCVGVDVYLPDTELGGGILGLRADAGRLPLRDRCATVVTARGLLHHVHEIEAVLVELARVVAPEGWLFVVEATRFDDETFAAMNRELEEAGHPPEPHPGIEPERLMGVLSGCGLSIARHMLSGEWTLATPPFVSRVYSVPKVLVAARRDQP